jgi:8-oxo-dGTP diphosphatase
MEKACHEINRNFWVTGRQLMALYSYAYPRPMVTVDCVVFAEAEDKDKALLLVKRKNPPFAGSWAFPGGFVDMDEGLEKAALRELEEETGISTVALTQIHCFGDPERDPRGRTITVVYAGNLSETVEPVANDDASEAAWFPLSELPPLAFDHGLILEHVLQHFNYR